jgi:hypothetical protein
MFYYNMVMTAIFDRLKTGIPELFSGIFPTASTQPLSLEKAARAARQYNSPYGVISIRSLIKEVGHLTQGSILVGACDDRLHFYMDLYDPRPGSVLISSEHPQAPRELLRTILSSAVLINTHRQLRFAYLFLDQMQSSGLIQQQHCFRSFLINSPQAGQLITQLADVAETRIRPGHNECLLILAIEGLDTLCSSLDDRSYDDLAWLIQNGPSVGIWPFITLDSRRYEIAGDELIHLFGTRILGSMDAKAAAWFCGDFSVINKLIPDKQFCVWFDEQWLKFWVPEPEQFS